MKGGAVYQRLAGNLAIAAGFAAVFADLAGQSLPWPVWVAIFAAYFGARSGNLKRSGTIILSGSILLFLGAWLLTGEVFGDGLGRAGFLFIFLIVMQYLAELADRSPAISRAAELIVSRPAGQRYLFVTFGTHVLALFLQIGAVILIMTLLVSRLRNASEDTVRSLAIAELRGFSSTAMWSPLSLGILIIFAHVTDVSYVRFIPIGLACAALFVMAGYWMERGRRARISEATALTSGEKADLIRVVGLAAMLVTGGLTWVAVFDVPLIEGMFTVVLILGGAWSALALATGNLTVAQSAGSLSRAGSALVNEVAIISGATVIGAVGSGLIDQWAGLQGAISPAAAALAALAVPSAIFSGGLIALNPVLTVTILSSALNTVWPDGSKLWLVLALSWGWSISAGGTPFTANVLMTAQKVGQSGQTVALRWNGQFTMLMLAGFSALAALGTFLSA